MSSDFCSSVIASAIAASVSASTTPVLRSGECAPWNSRTAPWVIGPKMESTTSGVLTSSSWLRVICRSVTAEPLAPIASLVAVAVG